MRILFLDDDPIRLKKAQQHFIGHDLTLVTTSQEAISALASGSAFDLVHLDHDLGGQVYVESGPNTGYEVAKYIASMENPPEVVIHSFNPVGAQNMNAVLKDVTSVKYIPFNF